VKRILIVLVLLFFSFHILINIKAENEYYIIHLDQTIDIGAQNFVSRSIDDALSKNYRNFVIIMNTFGGYVIHMENIIKKITYAESKGMNVITIVAPLGAHATSAGSYIALASTKLYMVKGTSIGSATPVIGTSDPMVEQKVVNAFAKYMETLAEAKGRNKTAAVEMVTQGKSYTAEEAYRLGLIDGVLNTTTITGALEELGIKNVEIKEADWYSRFLSLLTDPTILTILSLFTIFGILYGIAAQSEVLIASGIAALILTLVGYAILEPPAAAVALILIGSILILIELKIGEGLGAIPGSIILAIGFILFYYPISLPEFKPGELPRIHFFNIGLSQISVAVVIAVAGSFLGLYLHKIAQTLKMKTKIFDKSLLIGKYGYAVTDILQNKQGIVNVEAEEWTAESDEFIPANSRIKVINIEGNILKVKKVEE